MPDDIERPWYVRDGDTRPDRASVQIIDDPDEFARLQHACRVAAEVRDAVGAAVLPGVTTDELDEIAATALEASPSHKVLIEESVLGWKEFELEVIRDRMDNAIVVCSVENFDAMGVHTGDSITVAPALTLTDKEYQRMRDAAKAVVTEIGVTTGGCNIQFAIDPQSGRMIVIEMNPRVSRSSAQIIDEQSRNVREGNSASIDAMHRLKQEAVQMKEALLLGDLAQFATVMQSGWQAKKQSASSITNPMIDKLEELAFANGAHAAKVSGAGGGGRQCGFDPAAGAWRAKAGGQRRSDAGWQGRGLPARRAD